MMIEMKKKNKRSCFKVVEDRKHKARVRNILKYMPNQPKLIQFLIDNKADEGFIKALNKAGKYTRVRVYSLVDIYDSICHSFSWSSTVEGSDYWSKLNDEFNKIIRGDNEQPRTNLC